jgi:uncharacterized membrane protein YeaQ/YmgE (transglycosylase-associated protein family)
MSILMFIVLGLVAGLLARAVLPGRQSMGLVATALLGMAGSFLGGLVASLISGQPLLQFHSSGIIGSVIGAIVVLVIVGATSRRTTTRSYV